MILCICANPSVDHTLFLNELKVGDTNRIQRSEVDAGGKGLNTARIIQKLDGRALALSFLGGSTGQFVSKVLDGEGVPHQEVQVANETRSNYAVEAGNGPPTSFNGLGPEISSHELQSFCELISQNLQGTAWVSLAGSQPPNLPEDLYVQIAEEARSSGVKVLIDADGAKMQRAMAFKPDMIKPNRSEAERLLGRSLPTMKDAIDGVRELATSLGESSLVFVSLGSEGALLAYEGEVFQGVPPSIEVRSTVGSGDSFLGGFLSQWEVGKGVEESLRWALAAGAATAMSDGSRIGTRNDMDELVHRAEVHRVG